MRHTLVTALVSCATEEARTKLRRFLVGLSADELQFLAGFQGARILERCAGVTRGPNYGAAAECCAQDLDHKMIVLREYLARCGRSISAHEGMA